MLRKTFKERTNGKVDRRRFTTGVLATAGAAFYGVPNIDNLACPKQ